MQLSNIKVSPDKIISSHKDALRGRLPNHQYVLAVQDTTTLNYASHKKTRGLGPAGKTEPLVVAWKILFMTFVGRNIPWLGGFLGRKGDGEPGSTTIRRGMLQVMVIVSAYKIFHAG